MLYDPKWEVPVETKPLEPWRQVLLDGAQYIRDHGWMQNNYEDRQGRVCIHGALMKVSVNYHEARHRLIQHLGMTGFAWNDMPGRTKDEVIAVMERLANAGI